jgi:hypothetical protein
MNKRAPLVAIMCVACARGVDEGGGSSRAATGGASTGGSATMASSGGGPGSGGAGATGGAAGSAGAGGSSMSTSSTGGGTGCVMSNECTSTEYCDFPDDLCGAGAVGACTVRPPNCMNVYDPKCGCDGLQYANSCFAAMAGHDVDAYGLCM